MLFTRKSRGLCVVLFAATLSTLITVPSTRAAEGQPDSRGPLTAEALWDMKRLGRPALSPDGSEAVLAVTWYDEEDESYSSLWAISTADGTTRRLTAAKSKDSEPAWSPDGKWIAFVREIEVESETDDEKTRSQIFLLPTSGGEAHQLTDIATGVTGLDWFPDSSRVAFISRVWPDLDSWQAQAERMTEREDSKMTAKVWDEPWIRYWDRWIDDREGHVFSMSIDGGEPQAITWGSGQELYRPTHDGDAYDISPDGAEVAFASDTDETGVDPNQDIFIVSSDGGTAKNISTDNPGQDFRPRYSPDGRWISFAQQTINGFYGDTRRLVLHDRAGGTNRVITAGWDRSADGIEWASDSASMLGSIDDAGIDRVYRITIPEGKPQPVTADTSFSSLAIQGDVLVGLEQSFVQPPTLARIDPESGVSTKLSHFNDDVLATVDLGTYESVTYPGADGAEIQMWINYPPRFDDSRPWPLYLLMHGGPHSGVTNSFHWRWNAQVFAGWGYVVTWHNFHGSSGFGQEFCDSINPEESDLPYRDTIAAAEWLAAKPWIDGDRMAAGGGSFGGYLASVVLGREHPFKTLIAHAAVYNEFTQYGADYGASRRRFGEHWEAPGIVERNSPHLSAGKFETPTLVIHGENDYRVPLNHGIELFNTLQNRGVPSRFIYYPDENHWVLKRQNSIHWYGAKRDWLEQYIGAGQQ